MPTIYKIQCESCKRAPEAKGSLAGYVRTDGREGGIILPASYLAVCLKSGEFVCLPHPLEESTLKDCGFTWHKAWKEGRLFRIEYKICTRCGALHEERQIHSLRAGCLPAVIGGFLIVFLTHFLAHFSWASSFLIGYLGIFAILLLFLLLTSFLWRKKNAETKLMRCTRCDANEFITIPNATRKPIMCPYCATQSMHCQIAGKS